ncbi:MAG: hypothetical protein JWM92_500 [Candidatus Nomurabacteria bacterium]|jgi:hypothetical protein|nr:hypothetical protein [Candidatus Nomurabacteria bacterium]
MLIDIAILLVILWFLGLIGVYALGYYIHILLIVAIILIIIRAIRGDNPL